MTAAKPTWQERRAADEDAFQVGLVAEQAARQRQKEEVVVATRDPRTNGMEGHPVEVPGSHMGVQALTPKQAVEQVVEVNEPTGYPLPMGGFLDCARRQGFTVLAWPDGAVIAWERIPADIHRPARLREAYAEARHALERKLIAACGQHRLVQSVAKFPF